MWRCVLVNEILTVLEVALLFLIGLILIFDGYKVEKVLITLLWFILGYRVATSVLGYFGLQNNLLLIIVGVIVGLCTGAVGWKLDKYAFLIAVGYAIFEIIPNYFVIDNWLIFFVVKLVIAIVVALIALKFRYIIYAIVASLIGATLMKRAVFLLFPTLPTVLITLVNIMVVILVFIGLLSQLEEYQKENW